jgi:hypothetical protein
MRCGSAIYRDRVSRLRSSRRIISDVTTVIVTALASRPAATAAHADLASGLRSARSCHARARFYWFARQVELGWYPNCMELTNDG